MAHTIVSLLNIKAFQRICVQRNTVDSAADR